MSVYDTHTIVINIGTLPVELTDQLIDDVHKEAEKYISNTDPSFKGSRYYTNTPFSSNGERSTKTRYWTQDSRIYHILLGYNPDGSERVERTLCPILSPTDDWADDGEYITNKLGPIVNIPTVKYHGIEYVCKFEAAFTDHPRAGLSRSKLICSRVDREQIVKDKNLDELCKIFKRYERATITLRNGAVEVDYHNAEVSMILIMTRILLVDGVTYITNHCREERTPPSNSPRGRSSRSRGNGGSGSGSPVFKQRGNGTSTGIPSSTEFRPRGRGRGK